MPPSLTLCPLRCLWICTGRDPKEFVRLQKELLQSTMCGRVWHAGAFAYRCETCQTSESSAICTAGVAFDTSLVAHLAR